MIKRRPAYTVTMRADSTDSYPPVFETRNTDAHDGKAFIWLHRRKNELPDNTRVYSTL